MKKILILLFNVIFLISLHAQITNEQQVISNGGNYSEAGGMSLSWTLGETVIATFDNGGMVLTQGFQQPLLLLQGQFVVVPAGWSGISSYVIPDDPAVADIFSPVVSDLVILMDQFGHFYWPETALNTIDADPPVGTGGWVSHYGYKTKFTHQVAVFFEGDPNPDKVVECNPGWTIIPVLSPNNVPTSELFGPLGSNLIICKEIGGSRIYWPSQEIYSLNFLEPGKAYSIALNAAGSLDYSGFDAMPEPLASNIELNQLENNTPWNDVVFTGTSHTIAIERRTLENIPGITAGDYIGAFTQSGICAGLIQYQEGDNNVALTAFGDDQTTASLTEGFVPNEFLNFRMYKPSTGEEFILECTFDQNMPNTDLFASDGLSKIVDITAIATSIEEFTLNDVELYPNPANDRVTVNCIGRISKHTELMIYSIEEGKLVMNKNLVTNRIELDIHNLAQGVYFVKVTDGSHVIVKKLIKHRNNF
jgi:hypothetical protein